MKWALYDLSRNSPSFDVFTFLQYAAHHGCTAVYLKSGFNGQWVYAGEAGERARVKTIVIPAIELHGLKWEIGDTPPEIHWPKSKDKQGAVHRMNWLKDVLKPAPVFIPQESMERASAQRGKIIVILRTQQYQEDRNSGPDWISWASDHNAHVIRDSSEEPISLADRLALYEVGSLCIGVNSGNMAPNHYSTRSYISMKWAADIRLLKHKHEFHEGMQMPWATTRQMLVWNHGDSYKEIEDAYQAFRQING